MLRTGIVVPDTGSGVPAACRETGDTAHPTRELRRMASDHVVRLAFRSHFDMLDFVQVVSDELGKLVGFDGDAIH